ncbi:hypothetical protein GPJ56_007043 [Histomonas meleagridis]|uniref:uncharacterized protein n=1 Tax=Histomonas meleagridis TaxID=135588 RepID=UPI00355A1CF0|nr:hypothetical protein GPJ56_007043 [Histomonas meleagridis]KAH0801698.1 hypothetical protein GO595_005533 [Histomonas meleagridis]
MNIELTREMIDYAYNYSLIYRKYLPNSSFKGHAITWENQTKYTLRGYNTDVTLIKRKNLEGKLSPDVGRTMMAFFSGVGYIYRLCTIPIYTAQINKTNVVMNFEPINESDQFFEIISVTSC